MFFDIEGLIRATGYLGLFIIVFTESGLLVGMFFPGDSLLFTAGFLASQNLLNIWLLIGLIFVAAVLGDSTGYAIGRRFGPKVFKRKNSLFFDKRHIERSQKFYEKHGGKTIIIARFMPVVRTVAPVLAGVGRMEYQRFISFNVIGGLVWSMGLPLLGYYLGRTIPHIDRYLLPIVGVIVLLSVSPTLYHLLKDKQSRQRLLSFVKRKPRNPIS